MGQHWSTEEWINSIEDIDSVIASAFTNQLPVGASGTDPECQLASSNESKSRSS